MFELGLIVKRQKSYHLSRGTTLPYQSILLEPCVLVTSFAWSLQRDPRRRLYIVEGVEMHACGEL